MTKQPMTLEQIAASIDPKDAQMAVARAMVTMGSLDEWDSETIEWVAEPMIAIGKKVGLPEFTNGDNVEALTFWRRASGDWDEEEMGTTCGECEAFTFTDADGFCDECGEPKS